ncbi:hypothetical protein GGD83_002630 [Rhodoblastus sphagnicola]|uniref:hypothetical protein n=1 Tax=Rhodoblastus sphagnicola TaxID=333368 RepID=UPI0011B073A8|nr:hypothetical protein [Rhodoblastus sphagnicola]MBB4198821.1 hypothetical protein [Rhodoblastus sphagnicola]
MACLEARLKPYCDRWISVWRDLGVVQFKLNLDARDQMRVKPLPVLAEFKKFNTMRTAIRRRAAFPAFFPLSERRFVGRNCLKTGLSRPDPIELDLVSRRLGN